MSRPLLPRPVTARRHLLRSGTTLTELLVAIAIGALIVAAVLGVGMKLAGLIRGWQ